MSKDNSYWSWNIALATSVLNLTVKIQQSFFGLGYDYHVEEFNEDQYELLSYDSTDQEYSIPDYQDSTHYIFKVVEYLQERDKIKVSLIHKGSCWYVTISKGKRKKTELNKVLPVAITKCLLKIYL